MQSILPPSAALWCAVKGSDPQREINPPGNWFVPPGSNRSNGGVMESIFVRMYTAKTPVKHPRIQPFTRLPLNQNVTYLFLVN